MAGDLQYAREDLESLGDRLRTVADGVQNDGRRTSYDVEDVAHARVADALREFAEDWDDKRTALVESLTAISDMAGTAARTLSQADADLAAEIRAIVEGP